MSLSSLPLAKEVLGLNPTDEDWLQYCKIVGSPFGDVVIVASDKCAVFYVKKFDTDEKVYFKLSKTYHAEDSTAHITAISYIPVSCKTFLPNYIFWRTSIMAFSISEKFTVSYYVIYVQSQD